jgi:RNA polymerase sigma factor (sigma-70 family)
LKFEDLYDQYKIMVFNLAMHYLHNISDAEEITQDVFVSVYQGMNSFKKQSQWSTWIYKITINKSLDKIKSNKRKKRWAMITSIFEEHSMKIKHENPTHEHPAFQLEQKQATDRIWKAIDQLPEHQRTAIILCKIDHHSTAEAAEIMGLTVKAVESLIHRAKKKLEKDLSIIE